MHSAAVSGTSLTVVVDSPKESEGGLVERACRAVLSDRSDTCRGGPPGEMLALAYSQRRVIRITLSTATLTLKLGVINTHVNQLQR
ncbi:hypothetical protein RHA1_ro05406 [Rhodococcus jostii RHA1]|uniref:Uncharacterized protein n=1 Tax=Rhodococcus jostii (strain RHA1) TaxID=101510 RepID=Q0S5K0_RHOJR|nr:hypothetical protein RHA1_ro05406 [Rhodococcus jostii RHA1]